MALKKSELHASLWQSCDELRGGTDASQYKDYVLVLLFGLCDAGRQGNDASVVLGLDAPLGFPSEFVALAAELMPVPTLQSSEFNPYLFRRTERWLFEQGILRAGPRTRAPLSAIKDMIGSQATKGMHVLARFASKVESCGVWTSRNGNLRVIEAYPSACTNSARMRNLVKGYPKLKHDDKLDALRCALIAWLFVYGRDELIGPEETIPVREGWIWIPCDAMPRLSR